MPQVIGLGNALKASDITRANPLQTGQSAENATISDIRTQLPGEIRPEASGVDGLVVDSDQAPAENADLSSIELDDQPFDKVESDESALGSFIRKLPR